MPPLVSICLPTLNARRFLEPRMASIMAQTLTDWELIVCDSYSDDGTWEYIKRYADDPRVRMHRVPRAGLYAGWNECLRRATGEFIYIATADDTMSPDCLEKLSGALENAKIETTDDGRQQTTDNRQKSAAGDIKKSLRSAVCGLRSDSPAEIAVCDFDFIDETGRILEPRPRRVPGDWYGEWMQKPHWRPGTHELLVHLCLGVSWTTMTAVLFRRRLLERTGYFPENCGAHGDKVWAIATALFSDTVYVPGRLATWRKHAEQGSSQRNVRGWQKAQEAAVRLLREHRQTLPEACLNDTTAFRQLVTAFRSLYLVDYGLDRLTLRRAPAKFLRGWLRALFYEPRFALHRLTRGFAWNDPTLPNGDRLLARLLKEWSIPPLRELVNGQRGKFGKCVKN